MEQDERVAQLCTALRDIEAKARELSAQKKRSNSHRAQETRAALDNIAAMAKDAREAQ